jgi:hypothetical protein
MTIVTGIMQLAVLHSSRPRLSVAIPPASDYIRNKIPVPSAFEADNLSRTERR